MTNESPRGADVAQVFREARGIAIAALVRSLGDLDAAEDAVQEAFVAALSRWPEEGTPERPAAWIVRVAHRRGIDRLRRESRRETRGESPETDPTDTSQPMAAIEPLDDDLLRLIFMCCHPSLAMEARVALTLRIVCGLTTKEVARAFLVPEPTVAQRIVRAKRKIKDAILPFLDRARSHRGGEAGLPSGMGTCPVTDGASVPGGADPSRSTMIALAELNAADPAPGQSAMPARAA